MNIVIDNNGFFVFLFFIGYYILGLKKDCFTII